MHTLIQTVKTFPELTEKEQKEYISKHPEKFTPDGDDLYVITEDYTEILSSLGFDVEISFSGFCCQGDGASFHGEWQKPRVTWLETNAKLYSKAEPELASFIDSVINFAKSGSAEIVRLGHSGRYSHENSIYFVYFDNEGGEVESKETEQFTRACKGFMQHIYRSLEKRYDYLNSEEYILENPDMFDYIEVVTSTKIV